MKNLKTVDIENARGLLINACQQYISANAGNFWANHSLLGKSPIQSVKNLIKEFKSDTSVYQLICRVDEFKTDSQLVNNLKHLILLNIYNIPQKNIEKLGIEIKRSELFINSRGLINYSQTTFTPNLEAAIKQLFLINLLSTESVSSAPSLELTTYNS